LQKEQKEVELMQLQQRYFAHLTAVANNSAEVNADWANALLGRVFWGVHSHPVFIKLITEKLQKKMSKLKKPKFVVSQLTIFIIFIIFII
jgi:predicted transcriptional regulator